MGIVFSSLQRFLCGPRGDNRETVPVASANPGDLHLHPPASSSATEVSPITPSHDGPIVNIALESGTNHGNEEGITSPQPSEVLGNLNILSSSSAATLPPLSVTPSHHLQVVDTIPNSSADGDKKETAGPRPSELLDHSTLTRPLFALIIGINDYANFAKLSGAVNDAKEMKQYLVDDLRVPEDHIRTLLDHEATRRAIIEAFQDLRDDEQIKKGDAIVIFYAGHGGELPAPRDWRCEQEIQCLLPQDNDDSEIYPIPDRTIGALLEGIAKKKGDNITVIFDCCHSAHLARDKDLIASTGEPDHSISELISRGVELNSKIPAKLDFEIWGARVGKIPAGFVYHGLRSHVLLAACGKKERAHERRGHGLFSRELLEILKNNSIKDLTYADVIDRIYLEEQNPQCEGVNRHRALFDTRLPGGKRVHHKVDVKEGKCIIYAGLAHGISSGVELALYSDQKNRQGTVVIDDTFLVKDFETTVTTSIDLTEVSFAKLNCVGKVPLYLAAGENQSALAETLLRGKGDDTYAQVVEEVEKAKLEVAVENNLITFKVVDQIVTKFGLTELPYKFSLDDPGHILGAAAHFFWYLDLTNKNSRLGTSQDVAVNFYFLNKHYDDYGVPSFVPEEPGLCRKDPSNNLGVIEFDVDPDGRYGIEIENKTTRDLYLNAFLFNSSDLSIAPFYTQASAGNPDAPLNKGEILTLGYESGGIPPFTFELPKGQDVDVGYLKIFFSTQAIDLSDLEQMSPFPTTDSSTAGCSATDPSAVEPLAMDSAPSTKARVGKQYEAKSDVIDIWFAIQIPIVQKRKKN